VFEHGQPVYLQIPATDISTSARFYERVLGWKVGRAEAESGFEAPGLIGQWITDRPPAPDAGPVMWIHVDDVARTLTQARDAGAVPRQQPTPDGPRMLAAFSDPAGNLVGIAAHPAAPADRPAESSDADAGTRVENRTMPPCTIIPELVYDDVTEAGHWLCDTFGFVERWHAGDHRAQLSFAGGTIAITEPRTSHALPGPISLLVRVDDVDAHCGHARARGARIIEEPRDFPYGERQYAVEDLGGHRWGFSQSIADVAPEQWGGTTGPALRGDTHRTLVRTSNIGISVMLIVPDAGAAVAWYREALAAAVMWDLGGVAGLHVGNAPFFLHEANPDNPAEDSPDRVGQTSVRIEVFVDDPDALIDRAVAAGARPGSPVTAHETPWGTHRQGGFEDPFGHRWSVGDASPLRPATS
jgi:PhnB protein